ncbi:NIPSNAP family containing protein [Klebsiella pneumoniae]|nr:MULTISPECIES: NIPSNAP family protein [Enterobacteriaceae]SSF60216.1 NIPSNAP family containing protein [Klebsiella pneumoniae]
MCFIDPSTMHERLQCQVVTIRVTSLSVSSADTLYRRHEIDVVSFGNSLHDPDCYYLIHAFDSAENMTAVLDAFYAGADWRNGPREDIIGSTETSIKTVMNLPPESVEGLRVQS